MRNCSSNGSSAAVPTLEDFLSARYPYYVSSVPPHWLSQSAPPDRAASATVAAAFLSLCVVNNACAALLLTAFVKKRSLRTPSNCLLISLAVADVVLLTTCYVIVIQGFAGGPILGVGGCNLSGFLGTVGALAEIWSLTAVALDRFRAIKHPLESKKKMRIKTVLVIIALIWTSALTLATCPLLGWNSYKAEPYLVGCTFDSFSPSWHDRSYVLLLVLLAWALPLAAAGGCYLGIVRLVKSEVPPQLVGAQDNTVAEQQRKEMKSTLTKMVCFLLALWVASWTPYALTSMWIMFFKAEGLTQPAALVPTFACKISGTINAFLYGVRLPKFKKEISLLLEPLKRRLERLRLPGRSSSSEGAQETTDIISRSKEGENVTLGLRTITTDKMETVIRGRRTEDNDEDEEDGTLV